ncbi:MAG TPA: citrate/2-methylcitrate synthase [Candidatus Atribacteria bacterium]|nr:citrate/2-methylcitrate synthase [Candidatus Atribacteria bacterium]HPT78900.1 citrate/2-methylcitrate synthase [Candidatus Atribacteria bacterium]
MDEFVSVLQKLAHSNNWIEPEWYDKLGVKRGLRNKDGTGVLVGLTQIGEVHGYIMKEGEKIPDYGKLYYRGVDIEDIVEGCVADGRFGFEEVCFLLLFGKLPTESELDTFNQILWSNRRLPNGFMEDMILKAPSPNIMNKLARCTLASYSYDESPDDMSLQAVLRRSIKLIARFPAFVAYSYQAKRHYYMDESLYIHLPKKGHSTAECFLHMIRPDSSYTREEAEILDLALILHAEHGGGNNSTFTTRVVTSTGTDTYSAIAAGIGALKGPKHGGANLKVTEMIEDIKANVPNWNDEAALRDYLVRILKKEAFDKTGLIYGMGHAVYTLSDPRAVLLKDKARELAALKGMEEEFALYDTIERISPELFAEVKGSDKALCANVDFYSGFVYKMLGIPSDLYTPLFAIARVPSWCAHSMEEQISGGRIIRPAYQTLKQINEYKPLHAR